MDFAALIALPIALTLIAKLATTVVRRRSSTATRGPANDSTPPVAAAVAPPTFRVVALGTSGSGKTVFLASMFHHLNFRAPGRSYYLDTEPTQRVALAGIYATVSDTSQPWPEGTFKADTREFTFDCVAVDDRNVKQTVLRFSYLDYAGELLEREQEPGVTALEELATKISGAHALLGMIDGHRMLQLLRREPGGHEYFEHRVQPMFGFMQGASCPIHLLLSKWDLLRDYGREQGLDDAQMLDRVIERLMAYGHIKAIAYARGADQVVRVIPVSAVGSSFVDLDANGKVVKRSDGELRPANVDVPLCAVLPDLFGQVEKRLDGSMRHAVNAEMLRQLRKDAGAVVGAVLGRPAGAALRLMLQGALGRDVGSEAATLFVEWLARPAEGDGQYGELRERLERRAADHARVREVVLDDFRRTVLRLEATLPMSQVSVRW